MGPGLVMAVFHVGVWAPIGAMADTTKQTRAASLVFHKNFGNPLAHGQVDMSDDASDLRPSQPKCLGCLLSHETGLADRRHCFVGYGATDHRVIGSAALDEHRVGHVVRRTSIGTKLLCQVPTVVTVPQMMMRIDNRAVRIDRRFDSAR